MKIVINNCFGMYSLSREIMVLYARKKGLTLYPEKRGEITVYYIVPPEQRTDLLEGDDWYSATQEERMLSNMVYNRYTICDTQIERNDPVLVEVVEELQVKSGDHENDLKVVDIPDDVNWTIEDYDGLESVHEIHRSWS